MAGYAINVCSPSASSRNFQGDGDMSSAASFSWWAVPVVLLVPGLGWADDWPQWLGPKRDGLWRENGILAKFPRGGPKVLWRTPIGGGYAGPAVSGGKVYITDRVLSPGVS